MLNDLLLRYPEIRNIEIERPIIVVGLPRSGTTHLVNLIAADARRRALPYWESQEPFPLPGEGPDVNGVDPRFARSVAEHEGAQAGLPTTSLPTAPLSQLLAFVFAITFKVGDTPMRLQPIDTMTFNASGKITSVRSYFAPTDLTEV